MKPHLGITPKLTLVFVLFAAVLLAAVGLLAYRSGRAALEAATISELLATTSEKQAALESWVEERQAAIATVASVPGIANSVTAYIAASAAVQPNAAPSAALQAAHDQLLHELQARVGAGRRYLALLVLEPTTGAVIAATDPREEGSIQADQPFFLNGKARPIFPESLWLAHGR